MGKVRVNLTVDVSIPQKGVSVNILVYEIGKIMPRIFFALLESVFSAVEERTTRELRATSPGRYVKNGHQNSSRQLRTPFGLFRYRLAQVWDKLESKNLIPLYRKIFIPSHRQYIAQTTEPGVGLAIHLSYRRSTMETERIKEVSMSYSTLWRHFQMFAKEMCSWPNLKKIPYRFLMVDGTKVCLQEKNKQGTLSKQVQMRWALASLGENKPFDLIGFWIDESWNHIAQKLKQRLNYSLMEVLFSDGEQGIEENLLEEGMRHQPCILHGKRDFADILYQDGIKKPGQVLFQESLNSIPAMGLTMAKLEKLKPEDYPRVKELAEKTKQGFRELLNLLDKERYPSARTYIENFSLQVSTFFDWWFTTGKWIPLTTNAIESKFSQVTNRIKAVGRRWSKQGLLNWLKVSMNKIFHPEMWFDLWEKYLELTPTVEVNLVDVSYCWV